MNNIIAEKDDELAKLALKMGSNSNVNSDEKVAGDDPLGAASSTKVIEKESLQATIIELNSKIRKYERDIEEHLESVRVANHKVTQLEQLNLDSNNKYETINSQLTNKISTLEEKILSLQMIINNNKGKDDGLTYSLTHSLTHLPTHSLTHSLAHTLTLISQVVIAKWWH